MKFIDELGLAEGAVPLTIYAKALGLEGYVVKPEERDVLLRALHLSPPEPGQVVVYTGPGAVRYWAGAPPAVRVLVMPGGAEIPSGARCTGVEWLLRKAGVPPAEAKALARKPPTAKAKRFDLFLHCKAEEAAWDLLTAPRGPDSFDEWVRGLAFLGEFEPPKEGKPYEYTLVDHPARLAEFGAALSEARETDRVIGLDVESDEDENFDSKLVGISVAFDATQDAQANGRTARTFYLPVNGPIPEGAVHSFLYLHFAEYEAPRYIAHNGKFDSQVLAKFLAPADPLTVLRRLVRRLAGDGLIAAYVNAKVDYQTGRPVAKDLKFRALMHFGVEMLHFADMLALSGAKRASEAPLTDIGPYCAADSFWGVKVCEHEVAELSKYERLELLYQRVELPTVALVAEMELLGLQIDYALLESRRREVTVRVEVYRRYLEKQAVRAGYQLTVRQKSCPLHSRKRVDYEACEECDERGRVSVTEPLNPNSRLQVEAILQGTFHLPRMASTPSGDASNDEPALLRLREFTSDEDAKDWITFLLAWRKDDKVRGTYMDGLWERKRRDDWQIPGAWFIHSIFNQAVVESGRFSSKDPNGQNIPLNQRDIFIG